MSLHRFALLTAACTFVLLMLGGLVHSTGSSLACPDWPLCYGQVFPRMVGGVLVEHSHRLLAAAVGVLTIVVTVLAWRAGARDRALRWLGVAALVLVVFQGVLGGITVLYRLPMAISTAHLATSMLFFGTLLTIAVRARAGDPETRVTPAVLAVSPWIVVTGAAVYVQLVLGALVRHTGSGLACSDDPLLCAGQLLPAWGPAALHMTHRFVGYAVAVLVVLVAVKVLRAARGGGLVLVPRVAVVSVVLVVVQLGLGMYTVMTYVDPVVVTLHVGGGAALLACMVALWVTLRLGAASASRVGAPSARAAAAEAMDGAQATS